jgi:cation diffusion facilitator CzcD-associated flavoprotein CzcO
MLEGEPSNIDQISTSQTQARLESIMHSLNPQSDAEPAQVPNYPSSGAVCNNTPLFPSGSSQYTAADVKDFPQCTPQPLKIVHIGCGAAGILFAHKAERWLSNFSLTIYEKNPVIGGTWYENRYPGCACDIPAHTYVYPFEPNPEWSGYYSYSDEIDAYMHRCADKWGIHKFVQCNRQVESAVWDDDRSKWVLEVRNTLSDADDNVSLDECDVLINGSGVLNTWKWPEINGLFDFKGKLAHSAKWDQSIDWKGKRVAVLGTGSSSIQMVPWFAETASSLKVFMRNPTYIGPQIGAGVTNKEADPDAMDPQAAGKHQYTEKEKQRFRDDKDHLLKYRTEVEKTVVGAFRMFYRGSELNRTAIEHMQSDMVNKLGDNEELKKRLIPDWSPGCRRLTPGEGYLESFSKPNVTAIHSEITQVTPTGIITADGGSHDFDIIACATGFEVAYLPKFSVQGTSHQILRDGSRRNVYASVAIPGFPNYFTINGPRGNWGQGCILPSHEVQIEYIMQCLKRIQEDSIASMDVKSELADQLNDYMDAWHAKHSIWAENCRSWYKVSSCFPSSDDHLLTKPPE